MGNYFNPASSRPASQHWFEVGEVAREEGGIGGQADAGDFQILSAGLLAEGFQRIEAVRGIVIPWKNQPRGENLHLPDKALIWVRGSVRRRLDQPRRVAEANVNLVRCGRSIR